jgi:ribosomal protein S18 acetylase RimI-like enzyme
VSDPVYRALSAADLEAVVDLEGETLAPPWSRANLEPLLAAPPREGLAPGVWVAGTLVGAALAAWTGERVELYRLAVRSPFRRRGFARSLADRVLEGARKLGARGVDLELRADNRGARAFYAELGFEEVGRRVGYYRGDGMAVDAVLMSLELGNSPREPGRASS